MEPGKLAKGRWAMEEEMVKKAVFKGNLKTVLSQIESSIC